MNRAFSNASLGLYPLDPEFITDIAQLAGVCRQQAFIGEAIAEREHHYFAGERFLEQVNFMGCSPHIQFDASGDAEHFTHIILHHSSRPALFYGRHTRAPFCEACGKPNKSWQQSADLANLQLVCEHCQQSAALAEYDWRRSAGVCSSLIEITEIFPKEAQPQPALLAALQQHTGSGWDYFYF